jgi:hypothetical protein
MWMQNKKMFKPRTGKRVFKQCPYKENWKEILGSLKIKKKKRKEMLALFEAFYFS